jgi:hypothetical protein
VVDNRSHDRECAGSIPGCETTADGKTLDVPSGCACTFVHSQFMRYLLVGFVNKFEGIFCECTFVQVGHVPLLLKCTLD